MMIPLLWLSLVISNDGAHDRSVTRTLKDYEPSDEERKQQAEIAEVGNPVMM